MAELLICRQFFMKSVMDEGLFYYLKQALFLLILPWSISDMLNKAKKQTLTT